MKLRKNDNVLIVKGRDRGKRGQIQQIFPKDDKVLVDGMNVVLRHQKATGTTRQAGIIQMEAPLAYSSVKLMCPRCNRPVRVGFTSLDDGKKVRVCKKCQANID